MILQRPTAEDVKEIFRYASDPAVTRFVIWPRHSSIDDTNGFLQFSDAEWQRWAAGPFLIRHRTDGRVLGSTGLGFESNDSASTGYVLATREWGHGFATEALLAMVDLARSLGVRKLYAKVHIDHLASMKVLTKGGFIRYDKSAEFVPFPNLPPGMPSEAFTFERAL